MKLLIFDVDGVLEKEERLILARQKCKNKYIAEKFGLSEEEARVKHESVRVSLPEDKKHTSIYVFNALGFSRAEYFRVIDEVDPEGLVEPHENCEKMLKELKSGNRIVAYSNSPKKATTRSLEVMGIIGYIDTIYSVEEFEESKPSTRNIEIIMQKEGFKPENTVVIGNSHEKDILPAEKVGIRTILFDTTGKYEGKERITDLMEVVELVS